jgi:DeoR family transcriptional regulator of aga operon
MRWIADDHSLFLSAGTIAHRIVPLLVQRQGLSLTMHDLGMVTSARQFLSCEIHVTGGLLGADEPGLIGPAAELGVLSRPVDLCIVAVEGIDTRGRVLSRYPGAARLYSAAIRHAKKTLALAYNPVYSSTEGSPICNVGDLHGFVVNHDLEPAVSDLLSDHEFKIERKSEGLIELRRA